LVLRDIAEQLSLHESTISRVTTQKYIHTPRGIFEFISRVTTQKYIHTPRGIFEFKYFFSSHVSTANGGECSATAIRAMIRKFIAAEDATKPLSDSKIASTLVAEGIQVARRTVAKYRESMDQPARQRLVGPLQLRVLVHRTYAIELYSHQRHPITLAAPIPPTRSLQVECWAGVTFLP